ncbi:MAG: M48 family metallopeptidase [Nitrosomonadales bacterium]|nr:M48 family metallopeptidase [Nitrosomonadales bacterium]
MFEKLRRQVTPPAIEQRSIHLAGKPVVYTLKRTGRRRSIGLRVDDRGLTVAMPLRASEKWLHSVLQEKAGWVLEKLEGWQAKKPAQRQWADGEPILFRGESFALRIVSSLFDTPPVLHGPHLVVHVSGAGSPAAIANIVEQWYRREARQLFAECVEHFAPLMNVKPRDIRISAARTKWGSCTARGTVRLNWQLVKMPLHLIDYVVVHELAHLVEMNHSAAFWRVVGAACPDYARLRRELRKWSPATE